MVGARGTRAPFFCFERLESLGVCSFFPLERTRVRELLREIVTVL
jgi:hypothetical protein